MHKYMNKTFRFIIMAFVLLMIHATSLTAQEISFGYGAVNKDGLYAKFNPLEGTIDVAFVIATSYGANLLDGHCGFCEDDATITIGRTRFNIRQTDEGDCYKKQSSVNVSGINKSELTFVTLHENTDIRYGIPDEGDGGECKLVAYYRYKVKQSELGMPIEFRVKGTFWRRGAAKDIDVDRSDRMYLPTESEIRKNNNIDVPVTVSNAFNIDNDKAKIEFGVNHSNISNDNARGKYEIVDGDDNVVATHSIAPSNPKDFDYRTIRNDQYLIPICTVGESEWKYITTAPPDNWKDKSINEAAFKSGKAGFGCRGGLANMRYNTIWDTRQLYVRKSVNLNIKDEDLDNLFFVIYHDEDVEVYVNGVLAFKKTGYVTNYKVYELTPEGKKAFVKGDNTIAASVRQTGGGQYFDLGLVIAPTARQRMLTFDLGKEKGQLNPDYLNSYKLVRTYIPYGNQEELAYSTPAMALPFNAYPVPKDFNAHYDSDERTIKTEWKIENAPNKPYDVKGKPWLEDIMRVTFAKGSQVLATKEIPYTPNETTYTTDYQLPQDQEEAQYTVTISRVFKNNTATKELLYGKTSRSFEANSQHYSVDSVWTELSKTKSQIIVHWNINGGIWSKGSRCILLRQDIYNGNETEIELSKSKFLESSATYVDNEVINLHCYHYRIKIEAGGEYTNSISKFSNANTAYKPGEMISMQASQGEYTDKVILKWTSKNFERYMIERNRMDDASDKPAQIAVVENPSGATNNSYTDDLTMPGVIYQYNIIGLNTAQNGEVLQRDTISDFGFRKTSGDINGRVVFEDGSAVRDADVRITAYDEVKHYSMALHGGKSNVARLLSDSVMTGANEFTLQAMVNPSSSGLIFSKKNVFTLGIGNDSTVFVGKGSAQLSDSVKIKMGEWQQITATGCRDSVKIYMNGKLSYECRLDSLFSDTMAIYANTEPVAISIGDDLTGYLTELRLWSRVLSAEEIATNYNRYLVGNEDGLEVYCNFSFPCQGRFFDSSYKGTAYNRRHGKFDKEYAHLDSENIPSVDQLAYIGTTDANGVYAIRNVLYYGNGTSYMVTPMLHGHTFSPTSEVRFFSSTAATHSINFTDKSSFVVPVDIKYSGGDYPVEGVYFEIDGNTVMKENKIVTTDANGHIDLHVPIGVHKVQALKDKHTFSQDGYLLDIDGNHLNYQADMNTRTLTDSTRVLFVGRVAGGKTQGDKALGFGLSQNNLSANTTVLIKPIKTHAVNNSDKNLEYTYEHHRLKIDSMKLEHRKQIDPNAIFVNRNNNRNNVVWNNSKTDPTITAHVAEKTGEFYAWLLPEKYIVDIKIPGQDATDVKNIEGNLSELDLTNIVQTQSLTSITDSVFNKADSTRVIFTANEQLNCNKYISYALRVKPELTAIQLDEDGEDMAYFGDSIMANSMLIGKNDTIRVWNNPDKKGYYFDHPVVSQGHEYLWRLRMSENYRHNETGNVDHVACENVQFAIYNRAEDSKPVTLAGDSITGMAMYRFTAGEPDLSNGLQTIAIQADYGTKGSQTSVSWKAPFADANGGQEVFNIGSLSTGNNFVTAGPNNVLLVLRDPPGSNSYSYLKEGTSWSESETYKGSLTFNEGFNLEEGTGFDFTKILGFFFSFSGNGHWTHKGEIKATESYTGVNGKKREWKIDRSFKTSDSPSYVEADGDLFVGYSSNLVFGRCDQIVLVKGETYRGNKSQYIKAFTPENGEWVLASRSVMSMGNTINTMFEYAQKDIEITVIPNLIKLRNSLFTDWQDNDYAKTVAALRQKVSEKAHESEVYYVSKVKSTSKDFGTKDSYDHIYNSSYWQRTNLVADVVDQKGGVHSIYVVPDSVNIINQWVDAWKNQMAQNEDAKLNATKTVQNYSLAAGTNGVEYSETYATSRNASHGFEVSLGYTHSWGSEIENKEGVWFKVNSVKSFGASTTHGNTWASDVSRSHTYGFVMKDTDPFDYYSVDVLREPKWDADKEKYVYVSDGGEVDTSSIKPMDRFSTFIFKKVGGASCLPYEDAQKVKYLKGHLGENIDASTLKVDNPVIKIPNNMVEGVPMGDVAYVDIELSNASESFSKRPYILTIDDDTNPDGLEIYVDGVSVKTCPVFMLEYGQVLKKTLALHRTNKMNYDNIGLWLTSNHSNPSIAGLTKSTASFSVHFVPSSSPVNIVEPSGIWNYNTALPDTTYSGHQAHYMPVTINGYDINYPNFSHISLQTKRKGEGDNKWVTHKTWKKDELATMDGTITYNLVFDDNADNEYDMRAVSFSEVNSQLYERSSEIRTGVKDMIRPRPYGEPNPVNGILTAKDNIEILFNEPIAQGLVNKEYISVKGALNGQTTSNNSTFVTLDGTNSSLVSELEHNLTDKSVTIDMNVRPRDLRDAPLFAHGGSESSMEIGIMPDRRLQLRLNDKLIIADEPCDEQDLQIGTWSNIALTYDADKQLISAYCNGKVAIANKPVDRYSCTGPVEIGHCQHSPNDYFYGDISSIRIWQKVMTGPQIMEHNQQQHSGREQALMACYNLDEGKGTVLQDKTHGVNLVMKGNAQWTLPDGRAVETDGNGQYALLSAQKSVVTDEGDWTLQLWFKSKEGQKNATILSAGEAAEGEQISMRNRFGIQLNENGELEYKCNNDVVNLGSSYNDGAWHCLGASLSRTSGFAYFYVDGVMKAYHDADDFGGIQTAQLTVGARQIIKNTELPTYDNFFAGSVDDVQIWKLCRTQRQMEQEYNSELNGNEKGLIGYWPFDYYRKWDQGISLDTTSMNMADPELSLPGTMAGATFTKVCAPVKEAPMVADIPFEFITSERSIMILPTTKASALEHTTLTISVSDIQDLHGNVMASPVTWTALVNQSKVNWISNTTDVILNPDEEYSDMFYIINECGTNCNYSITNIPAWMNIEDAEGICPANEIKGVKFTINKGMAIGNFNEILFLNIEGQNPSSLFFTAKVRGQQPDWKPSNPKSLYKTNIFGQMQFNGHYSEDTDDMIGAFVGNKCLGAAHTTYDPALKMHYALLTVHYDNADTAKIKNIEYRMFDASTGMTYNAKPSMPIVCKENAVYGTPTSPVVFKESKEIVFEYNLKTGWNWISLPLYNELLENKETGIGCLAGTYSTYDIFKSFDRTCNFGADGKWAERERFPLNNNEMYMVRVKKDVKVTLRGSAITKNKSTINIKPRWNWISYTPLTNLSLLQALAGYEANEGDIIKNEKEFAIYSKGFWVGSLKYMEPGCGYMLYNKSDNDKTLTYPSSSSVKIETIQKSNSYAPHTMGIVAEIEDMMTGDSLVASTTYGHDVVAEPVDVEGNTLHFLNLSEDEGTPVHFFVKRDNELICAINTATYSGNVVDGTIDNPVRIVTSGKGNMTAYPTTATIVVYAKYDMEADGDVSFSILDVQGRIVKTLPTVNTTAGSHTQEFDITALTSGHYIIRKTCGNNVETVRFIKK